MNKKENASMSRKRTEPITAESIRNEISVWIADDGKSGGAWDMYVISTVKNMKKSYDVTMQYLKDVTKEHFDFIIEGIEEVVHHFGRIEMVELIESLYAKFYGDDKGTDLYRENVEPLRAVIKE